MLRLLSRLILIALSAAAGGAAVWFLRPQGPDVELLTPVRARPGEVVTLKGSRFAPQGSIVLFGDRTGSIVNASADEIRAAVPAIPLEGTVERHVAVRVLVGDRASTPFDLTVYGAAEAPAPEPEAAQEATPEAAPPAEAATAPAPAATPMAVARGPERPAAPPATAPAPRPAPEPATPATVPPQPAPAATPRPTPLPKARPTPAPTPAAPPPTVAPRPPAPAAKPAPKPELVHTFVLERSAATNKKKRDKSETLAGFDTAGVDMKSAPEIPGRIDFEITPSRVKPGDRYTVTAFLINDGSKTIRIKEMFVATTRNGVLSAAPVPPRIREVAPRQRQSIGVFSEVWQQDVVAWAMDVSVTSEKSDVYKNQVKWN